jgi:hypothetical protein
MEEVVTIASFSDYHQAHIFKSMLESEGISCTLLNENMHALFPLPHSGISGIRIQVFLKDSLRALDIYYEGGFDNPNQGGSSDALL